MGSVKVDWRDLGTAWLSNTWVMCVQKSIEIDDSRRSTGFAKQGCG